MSADLKVVQFQQEGYKDALAALKEIVSQLESGELEAVETGALVILGKGGAVETFGFGPKSDELQVLGALRLGEQVVTEAMLYPEP